MRTGKERQEGKKGRKKRITGHTVFEWSKYGDTETELQMYSSIPSDKITEGI